MNENYYTLSINTSGKSSAVLTKNNTIEKVLIEDLFSKSNNDDIPFCCLLNLPRNLKLSHVGLTSTNKNSKDKYSCVIKFLSLFAGVSSADNGNLVPHQENHYLRSLNSIINTNFQEAHVFAYTNSATESEYGRPHESIFILNPEREYCELAFRAVLGNNKTFPMNVKVPKTFYKRKTISLCDAIDKVVEYIGLKSKNELFALSCFGERDKLIPKLTSTYGASYTLFGIDKNGDVEFLPVEYLSDKSYSTERLQNVHINLCHNLQKDIEDYVINSIEEYFTPSSTGVVASQSKNVILTGELFSNTRLNYILSKKFGDRFNLIIDPICDNVSYSMGLAYELIGSSKIEPVGRNTLYLGNELELDYLLNSWEEDKEVTPSEVAKLLSEGNIVAIAQGCSEIGEISLGNRSILMDPRKKDGKIILNKSKLRPGFYTPCATVLSENAKDWFDMGFIDESPYGMFAVDTLENRKDEIPVVVHYDGSCRVQTLTKEQNENYYNLINEFSILTGVPILANTSLNVNGYPLAQSIDDVLSVLRCTDINYLYLPEIGKLLYIPLNEEN